MNLRRPKLNLSLRRFLIDLNTALDDMQLWIDSSTEPNNNSIMGSIYKYGNHVNNISVDVLLLEDRNFYRHIGFEMRSIPRIIKRRFIYKKFGGMSTIDQLLVRTKSKRTERTIKRKINEITLSVIINFHKSKDDIFLSFLNTAYLGPQINGVNSASLTVFGKQADTLNLDQSGFIASLLPYPLPSNVAKSLRDSGPKVSSSEIISEFSATNPWWTSKIRNRTRYLEKLRIKYSEAFLRETNY